MRNPLSLTFRLPDPFRWKMRLAVPRWRIPRLPRFRNPLLIKQSCTQWSIWLLIAVEVAVSIWLFFAYVDPAMLGKNNLERIGPDSMFYLWQAGLVRDNPYGLNSDPTLPLISLASNYFAPVMIAKVLQSNFAIMCFDYVLLALSVWYLGASNSALLTALLLLNPLVLVSVLTLNKEILAILSTAMLVSYLRNGKKLLLASLLAIAVLTRWEHAAAILLFLFLRHWKWRWFALMLIVLGITFAYPALSNLVAMLSYGDKDLHGGTLAMMQNLENHYLYFVVAIPKALFGLVGGLFHPSEYGTNDVFNTFIIPIGSGVNLLVLCWFLLKRKLALSNDVVFFAFLYALLFTVPPFIQVRYLLPVYVALCLSLSQARYLPSDLPVDRHGSRSAR